MVVIEHNLEVIKTADWIIDLGPEGGDGGGEIVAAGTPEDVVKVKRSYTGQFLKPVLARREAGAEEGDRGGGVSRHASRWIGELVLLNLLRGLTPKDELIIVVVAVRGYPVVASVYGALAAQPGAPLFLRDGPDISDRPRARNNDGSRHFLVCAGLDARADRARTKCEGDARRYWPCYTRLRGSADRLDCGSTFFLFGAGSRLKRSICSKTALIPWLRSPCRL